MARPKSNIKSVCQNQNCAYFLKEKGKDLVKRGTNTAGHQRYYCKHCNKYLVETKGTPLYNKKLSERKIKAICTEFVESKGIRSVERTLHVHRDTVMRLLNDVADHAHELSSYLVHDLGLSTYEVDELLTIVKKNRERRNRLSRSSLDHQRLQLQHV